MKYDFYADAGHGWLKVSIDELVSLGIAEKITGYSYMRGKWAYLEEDADVSTFCNAKKIDQLSPFIREHTSNTSKIRSYESFDYEQFLALNQAIQSYDTNETLRKWVNTALNNKAHTTYFSNVEKYADLSHNAKTWFYNIAKTIKETAYNAANEWLKALEPYEEKGKGTDLPAKLNEVRKELEVLA